MCLLTQPKSTPSKRADTVTAAQYVVFSSPARPTTHTRYQCKHCLVQNFSVKGPANVTRLRRHITLCGKAPASVKDAVQQESQAYRRNKRVEALTPTEGKTFAAETIGDIRSAIMAEAVAPTKVNRDGRYPSSTAHSSSTRSGPPRVGSVMPTLSKRYFGSATNKDTAALFIRGHLECAVKRGDCLSRMVDPSFRSAMIVQSPGIGPYLPADTDAVYRLVEGIRDDARDQIEDLIKEQMGMCAVSLDSATVNGKSVVLYSFSKGDVFHFEAISELGSLKVSCAFACVHVH